jgi:acyl-[acyl-carrier-protein] desaturase
MAVAGIYDLRQHRDEVVMPVLRFWGVFDVEGLSAEGEQARSELAEFLDSLEKNALRFEEKREVLKARLTARA